MLYERCEEYNIPYRKMGKLVVAKNHQLDYINNLHAKAMKLRWPPHSPPQHTNSPVLATKLLTGDQARELESDLSPNIAAALSSPETGIIDSHAFMESLEKDIMESEGGVLAYSTAVVRVDPYRPPTQTSGFEAGSVEHGWVVQTVTGGGDDSNAILARTLINATGLSGHLILNSLLSERCRIPMYYARGSYAAYSGPGISRISRLIYPCPETGGTKHSFQSLGTHLTFDLQGKVRFGPDIEWISPPVSGNGLRGEDADFWRKHLIPDDTKLEEMHKAVTDYLPGVILDGMRPDYVGIRPKLGGPGSGFQDFMIRVDFPSHFIGGIHRRGPMISTLGIESPGLTSSLAIAEHIVEDILIGMDGHV
jgi:2-hydroxyglutarate dehydrogenase